MIALAGDGDSIVTPQFVKFWTTLTGSAMCLKKFVLFFIP